MAQDDATLLAHMLEEMGNNIGGSIKFAAQRRLQEKQLDLQSITKIKDFMSLPPDKRKALLLDPAFKQDIIRTLDPEAFGTPGKAKKTMKDSEGMASRSASAMALGGETPQEKLAREKATSEATKADAEARMAKNKADFATGVKTATPMDLVTNFDFKDPIAATLMAGIPKEDLKNIAMGEKKMGPLYQQQQQQEWYKWGLQQGFSPGLAMTSALSISKGEWDKLPQQWQDPATGKMMPVRGEAERKLALDAMNANSRAKEVQNTMESSIATSSAQLAEKSGLSLDQSRANVVALRAGKPIPFATPMITEHAIADLAHRKLEVDQLTQKVLDDKVGIGIIKESLTAMVAQYKNESGTFSMDSAKATDLKDKIGKLQEELSSRLASRYGIKFDKYEDLHTFAPAVKRAMGHVVAAGKATGAFTADLATAFGDVLKEDTTQAVPGESLPVPPSGRVGPNVGHPVVKHTPEQEAVLKNLSDSFTKALSDPEVPPEQKKAIKDYIDKTFMPAYHDPSKFLTLFNSSPVSQD